MFSHVLKERHPKPIVWSRTKEGAERLLALVEKGTSITSPGCDLRRFPWRGALVKGEASVQKMEKSPSRVVFAFSGLGGEWSGMGADLYAEYHAFREVVDACAQALEPHLDLVNLLTNPESDLQRDPAIRTLAVTVLQLGLVAVLEECGLSPDFYAGYSVGELACAVLDGVLSPEEAARAAWERGRATSLVEGSVVATDLSEEQAHATLKRHPDCVLAGVNSPDNTSIAGSSIALSQFIEEVKVKGHHVQWIDTNNTPYHHPTLMQPARDALAKALSGVAETRRSSRWLWSRRQLVHNIDGGVLADGLATPVAWAGVLKQLPEDCLILEIGPSSRLGGLCRRTRPDLDYQTSLKPDFPLSSALCRLWMAGASLFITPQRPPRSVREAQTVWDHREHYRVPSWRDFIGGAVSGVYTSQVTLDLKGTDRGVMHHNIDGRILVPGVAYLVSVWRTIAQKYEKALNACPIALHDITFHQAVQVPEDAERVGLDVIMLPDQTWSVLRSGDLIAQGAFELLEGPEDNDPDLLTAYHLYPHGFALIPICLLLAPMLDALRQRSGTLQSLVAEFGVNDGVLAACLKALLSAGFLEGSLVVRLENR